MLAPLVGGHPAVAILVLGLELLVVGFAERIVYGYQHVSPPPAATATAAPAPSCPRVQDDTGPPVERATEAAVLREDLREGATALIVALRAIGHQGGVRYWETFLEALATASDDEVVFAYPTRHREQVIHLNQLPAVGQA